MTSTKLKSIQEHNESMRMNRRNSLMSGVACPGCGNELEYEDHCLLLSNPPQRRAWCFTCNEIHNLQA